MRHVSGWLKICFLFNWWKVCLYAVLVLLFVQLGTRRRIEDSSFFTYLFFETTSMTEAILVEKKISIHSSEAMLDPNCLYGTMVAAANAVSHLASVGPIAREKLRKRYVSMVKAPGGSWGKPGWLGWKVLNRTGQEFLAKLWQFPYTIHRGTFLSLLTCILNQP